MTSRNEMISCCGSDCSACYCFGNMCKGCNALCGKVFHVPEEEASVIADWMSYYNKDRYIWDLARLSPDEYYKYYTTGEYPILGIITAR